MFIIFIYLFLNMASQNWVLEHIHLYNVILYLNFSLTLTLLLADTLSKK